ncbi:hypothetical protein ACSZMS_22625, partial [Aeromonas hydrophila]
QPEASSPGAKDENTGAGLCRSRLVVQERLGHYKSALPERFESMAACEWESLRHWLRQSSHFSTRQDKAILRDWQNAFELYGMAPMIPDWQPMVDMSKSIDPAAGLKQLQYWR